MGDVRAWFMARGLALLVSLMNSDQSSYRVSMRMRMRIITDRVNLGRSQADMMSGGRSLIFTSVDALIEPPPLDLRISTVQTSSDTSSIEASCR